jgi:hypothetical protein
MTLFLVIRIFINKKMADIIINERQLNLISERQQINESLLSFESILMAAGFIPVIGGIADIALICYYLYKGEKLYAALMLIGLIPGVGQWIAAPIVKLFKGSREGVIAMKEGGIKLTQYLAKHPEAATKFANLGKYVNSPVVTKTVEGISKVNAGLGSKLKNGLTEISGGGALAGLKAGGKEAFAGGSFKTGLKDYFQGQRLTKYFAKHGVLPEKGIQTWWLNVGAGRDRRNAFRKFIMTNNLLDRFGIPSITTFEKKMSNDAEFREKIANDPKISDYIAQNYNSEGGSKSLSNNITTPVNNTTAQSTTTTNNNPLGNLFGGLLNGQLGKVIA